MTDLTKVMRAIARKHPLRDAWQILIDGGVSKAKADRLIAEADRQINDYILNWASAVRSASKKRARSRRPGRRSKRTHGDLP
jgi:hypothetical protein